MSEEGPLLHRRPLDQSGYREIARLLDAPESSVRGWLATARKRVQSAIDECCPLARPLPTASGIPIGAIAASAAHRGKSAVATFPSSLGLEAHPVAELRSPIHQHLDLSAGARIRPGVQTD